MNNLFPFFSFLRTKETIKLINWGSLCAPDSVRERTVGTAGERPCSPDGRQCGPLGTETRQDQRDPRQQSIESRDPFQSCSFPFCLQEGLTTFDRFRTDLDCSWVKGPVFLIFTLSSLDLCSNYNGPGCHSYCFNFKLRVSFSNAVYIVSRFRDLCIPILFSHRWIHILPTWLMAVAIVLCWSANPRPTKTK